MVEVTVEAIDRSDGLSKVVGFAFFPLFLNSARKVPNTEKGAPGVILQNGAYQVPLYIEQPEPGL